MSGAEQMTPVDANAARFNLAVQRSRLGVMLLMAGVVVVARSTGVIDFDLVGGTVACGLGLASVPLFMALQGRARSASAALRINVGYTVMW